MVNDSNPIEVQKSTIDFPIFALNLPTRIERALVKKNIETLVILSKTDANKIIKIKNLGIKSATIISTAILNYINNNSDQKIVITFDENLKFINCALSELSKFLIKKNNDFKLSKNDNGEILSNFDMLENYCQGLYKWMLNGINPNTLSTAEKHILHKRLRFFTESSSIRTHTLEEIAQNPDLLVTRERIRQIEARLLKKINKNIQLYEANFPNEHSLFKENLNQIIDELKCIEWPDHLSLILKKIGFEKIKLNKNFFEHLIKSEILKNKKIKLFKFLKLEYFVSEIGFDNKKVKLIIRKNLSKLKRYSIPSIYEKDLQNCSIKPLLDSENIVIRSITSKLSPFRYSYDGLYLMKKMGHKEYAYKILDENNKPMHYSDIYNKMKKIAGSNSSKISFANCLLASKYIHCLGNGFYALEKWGMEVYKREVYYGNMTVDSLVEECIKNNPQVLNKEIIDYVLRKRKASLITINQSIYNLNKKYNRKINKNTYRKIITKFLKENGPSKFDAIYKDVITHKGVKRKAAIYTTLRNMKCNKDSDGNYYLSVKKAKDSPPTESTIMELLKKHLRENKPCTLDEIVSELSQKKIVSKNTIRMYLSQIGVKQDESRKYSL